LLLLLAFLKTYRIISETTQHDINRARSNQPVKSLPLHVANAQAESPPDPLNNLFNA
jgi:hypothetical protein